MKSGLEAAAIIHRGMGRTVSILTIDADGQAVAGCMLIDNTLTNLLVHKDYRGMGLGSALVRLAQKNVLQRTLVLLCHPDLQPFYAKLGFRNAGPADGVPGAITMTWEKT